MGTSVTGPREPRVFTTMRGVYPPYVVAHDRFFDGLWSALRGMARIRAGDALLVNGGLGLRNLYGDLMLAIACRRLSPRTAIVVSDPTFRPRSVPGESRHPWLYPWIARWSALLLRLVEGPLTQYCFLSRIECEDFVAATGVAPERVHFTPFFATAYMLPDLPSLQAVAARREGEPYLFSGGNTLRDWPLLRAAVGDGGIPLVIATSRDIGSWPADVRVVTTSHEGFFEAMAGSSGVVLPLVGGIARSAGQQTYLNAMCLGKPVALTDAAGVLDHVDPDDDALVVGPDAAQLRTAMERMLAGGPDIERRTANGLVRAAEGHPVVYSRQLAEIALAAAGGR